MNEIGEAVGTAAEGGLYGRAFEKREGEAPLTTHGLHKGHFAEDACLNCGTPLQGPHCHQCGQKAHLHRTLRAFVHDLSHGALHFDSKTWRTLPKLFFKPGELTRRYIAGERAKFVSPMALFLFGVFLMFAVFQAIGLTPPTDITTSDMVRSGIEQAQQETEDRRDDLSERLAALPAEDPDRASLEADLAEAEQKLADLDEVSPRILTENGSTGSNTISSTIPFVDGMLRKWSKNPGLMLYKLQANSYKFSWLLIPLSIPFVWLLFAWKRRFRAYDHAIFVTYSLAFMSLLFIAVSVMGVLSAPEVIVGVAAFVIPPIHIYKQLRGAYGLSRFSALWRLTVLLFFITVVLVLFLQLLLVLGAF